MKNYIKKPNYIENIKYIHSNNFKKINFEKYLSNDVSAYNLDLLRDIYREDKNLFFNIRDELLLRGFEIKLDSKSNLFPTIKKSGDSRYIINNPKKPEEGFKQINFDSLGLGDFVNRMNIDSDVFFHLIPLDNFSYINQGINIDILAKELIENNFLLIEKAGIESYKVQKRNDEWHLDEPAIEPKDASYVKVEDYFSENTYNKFVDYCYENKVFYVQEITESLLNEFKDVKFIGNKKHESVIDKYEIFVTAQEDLAKKNEPLFDMDKLFFGQYEIKQYFDDPKFHLFVVFCKNNNLQYLEDLTNGDLNLFRSMKGVGDKRVLNIIKRVKTIGKRLNLDKKFIFHYELEEFDLHSYSVKEILQVLKVDEQIDRNIMIEDIYDRDIRDLDVDKKTKMVLLDVIMKIINLKGPNNIIKNFLEKVDDRSLSMLIDRYERQETLQTIGDRYDVTRERVRQIMSKTSKQFISYLKENSFKESIMFTFLSFDYSELSLITKADFKLVIDEKYMFILNMFADLDEIFSYLDNYEVFFLTKKDRTNFIEEINSTISQLPSVFTMEDAKEVFEAHYLRDEMLSIALILEGNGFKRNGRLYSKYSLTISDIMMFIFDSDFKNTAVEITPKSFRNIIKMAKDKYDYAIENPLVSVLNMLRESEGFLLVNSNTFKRLHIEEYDVAVLEKCLAYGEQVLLEKDHINIQSIYDNYAEKLKLQNIDNKIHLYSILKHLYSDKLHFGKGNTLNIYKNLDKKIDESDMLIQFMKKNKGICSRDDIKEEFHWSDQKITLKTSVSNRIITWDKNYFRLSDGWISEDAILEVESIINNFFNEYGFITEGILFEEAHFSEKLSLLIVVEKINSSERFRSSFRPFIKNLKGNAVLITPAGSKYETINDVLIEKFSNGVTRDELNGYLRNDLFYADSTVAMILNDLLNNNIMVEINLGYLYPWNNISISEDTIDKLLKYIKFHQEGKPYIILKKLEGYRSILPPIDVEWTPYIMRQLLIANGYKVVKMYNNDYRTDQLILAEEHYKVVYIDEIIYKELKENYDGNWHESYIAAYLEQKGFIYKKNSKRSKLSLSLYKNSKLITVDEIGRVQLGGD